MQNKCIKNHAPRVPNMLRTKSFYLLPEVQVPSTLFEIFNLHNNIDRTIPNFKTTLTMIIFKTFK